MRQVPQHQKLWHLPSGRELLTMAKEFSMHNEKSDPGSQ